MSSLRSFRSPGWCIFVWLLRKLSAALAAKKEDGGMWRTWSANICGCLFYGSLGLWRLEFRQGLDGPGGDTAIVVLRTRNDHPLAYLQISHTHPVYFSMTAVSVACTWVSPSEVVTIRVSSSTDLMVPNDAATRPRAALLPRLGRPVRTKALPWCGESARRERRGRSRV